MSLPHGVHCKKYPFTHGYFVAIVFRILTQPVPHTSVSVNRRNNEARAGVATRENSPRNVRRYTDNFYSVDGSR